MKKLMLLLLTITVFASCNTENITPEEITNNNIQGVWEAESHIITDGKSTQYITNRIVVEFEATSNITGKTNWNYSISNERDNYLKYNYEVINDGNAILIENNELQVSFTGTKLVLMGINEDEQDVITFNKL